MSVSMSGVAVAQRDRGSSQRRGATAFGASTTAVRMQAAVRRKFNFFRIVFLEAGLPLTIPTETRSHPPRCSPPHSVAAVRLAAELPSRTSRASIAAINRAGLERTACRKRMGAHLRHAPNAARWQGLTETSRTPRRIGSEAREADFSPRRESRPRERNQPDGRIVERVIERHLHVFNRGHWQKPHS